MGLLIVGLTVFAAAGHGTTPGQAKSLAEAYYGHATPYMNDALPQLKHEVPALDGLSSDGDQSQLERILDGAGDVLETELPKMPNLAAREEVTEGNLNLPPELTGHARPLSGLGSTAVGPDKQDLEDYLHAHMMQSMSWKNFDYFILARRAPDGRVLLEESRSDPKTRNAAPHADLHGIGFGYLWLMFIPENRSQSKYRYLGQQKMDGHKTYVVTFAQLPDRVEVPGEIAIGGKSYPLLYQGIVWIDQTTFQIVRLRADLLAPLPDIQILSLTSDLLFREVRIPKLNLPLWLPRQVEVIWRRGNFLYGEIHRYDRYRLFQATAKILPAN